MIEGYEFATAAMVLWTLPLYLFHAHIKNKLLEIESKVEGQEDDD